MEICFILWQYVLVNCNMLCGMAMCSVVDYMFYCSAMRYAVLQYVLLNDIMFCYWAICSAIR